jgi:hypothetical protein
MHLIILISPMKKITLVLIASICVCLASHAQENSPGENKVRPVFTAGISYSYITAELQLSDLSNHSVWYGTDFGTYELTPEEIDDLNDHIDRKNTVNNVNLEFGMTLFGRPESKWKAGVIFLAGLARSNATIYNSVTDTNEYLFDSKLSKPCLGVGFDVSYAFNARWGLVMKPYFVCTFGHASKITDNINVAPEGFTQSTTDTYRSFYQRLSLMATFSAGRFVFSAGPGFYLLISNHEYTIEREYVSNGDLLLDEIHSKSINRSFMDASVSARWNIAGPFSLFVFTGIGKDIIVNSGLKVTL